PRPVGAEDERHPVRVIGMMGIDRVAGGLELVEVVAASVRGNTADVAGGDVDLTALAARFRLAGAAGTQDLTPFPLPRRLSLSVPSGGPGSPPPGPASPRCAPVSCLSP